MTRLRAAKSVRFVRHRLRLTNQQGDLDNALEPSNSFHTSWQPFCTWLRACCPAAPVFALLRNGNGPSRRQARGENTHIPGFLFLLLDRGPGHDGEMGKRPCPMRLQQQQSAESDAENMQHFVARRPSPRARTANATQACRAKFGPALRSTSMSLNRCLSLTAMVKRPQLVERAVSPLHHHQTSSGPVMGSSVSVAETGRHSLKPMHCGEPRFSAAALAPPSWFDLMPPRGPPNTKNGVWSRSDTRCQVLVSGSAQTLHPGYALHIPARAPSSSLLGHIQLNTTLPMPETHWTFSESTRLVPLTRHAQLPSISSLAALTWPKTKS